MFVTVGQNIEILKLQLCEAQWIYHKELCIPIVVLYCGRVPAANAPGWTAAEDLLYKPWSLVIPTCTARCLHQRP